MQNRVIIPSSLRQYTENTNAIELSGNSVAEILEQLTSRYPSLTKHLFREEGTLRSFVNVYINETDIRSQQHMNTPVKEGDVIVILPSVAGG